MGCLPPSSVQVGGITIIVAAALRCMAAALLGCFMLLGGGGGSQQGPPQARPGLLAGYMGHVAPGPHRRGDFPCGIHGEEVRECGI